MKKFIKNSLACALALTVGLGCMIGLSACSNDTQKPEEDGKQEEQIDYKTASYQTLKGVKWDDKTVKYQFLNDRIEGYGSSWPVCLNLYEDGSAAAWQATVTGFHVTHWAIEDKYVLWDFYGAWEENGGTVKLTLKGEGATLTTDFGERVTPEALEYDVAFSDGKADIPEFVLVASVGVDIKGLVSCDGSVAYDTLTEFFESYKDEYSEE